MKFTWRHHPVGRACLSVFVVALVLLLAACARMLNYNMKWDNPAGTERLKQDYQDCKLRAASAEFTRSGQMLTRCMYAKGYYEREPKPGEPADKLD